MKALTIWQPWASLIIANAKPYEFRRWRVPRSMIGQRIVIHAAAKKVDKREVSALLDILDRRFADVEHGLACSETCLRPELAMPILRDFLNDRLPMASGLGTATIGEPIIGTEVAHMFGVPRANDSDRDEHANWGWPMINIEAWPEPIPMRGAQGFWNWPTPEETAL